MLAPMEGYKTLRQLAEKWRRSQPTLRQQILSGVLKAEKVGRDWLVKDEDADEYERTRLGRRGFASPDHPRRKPAPPPNGDAE